MNCAPNACKWCFRIHIPRSIRGGASRSIVTQRWKPVAAMRVGTNVWRETGELLAEVGLSADVAFAATWTIVGRPASTQSISARALCNLFPRSLIADEYRFRARRSYSRPQLLNLLTRLRAEVGFAKLLYLARPVVVR